MRKAAWHVRQSNGYLYASVSVCECPGPIVHGIKVKVHARGKLVQVEGYLSMY